MAEPYLVELQPTVPDYSAVPHLLRVQRSFCRQYPPLYRLCFFAMSCYAILTYFSIVQAVPHPSSLLNSMRELLILIIFLAMPLPFTHLSVAFLGIH